MSRIASIVANDGTITLMLDNSNYTIDTEHPNYTRIKECLLEGDADSLVDLVDIPKSITTYANGKCEVTDGVVHFNGVPIHNVLTERILHLMNEGFPFEPMLRFLENLMENPSKRAVDELYDFLQHKHLPVTEDGHFLAYKGTREDKYDRYSGTILNEVGHVIEMPRNQVDDERAHECSHGLHVGTIEYVRNYCTERMIIVKVNPRDCVSVPRDHDAQKLRVCRYEILSLYEGDLTAAAYNSSGGSWNPSNEDCCDDDCFDDDCCDEDLYVDVDIEGDEDYGLKPDGHRYWNNRDSSGKFTSKK